MEKSTTVGVIIVILLFFGLCGFIASKIQIEMPYNLTSQSLFDVIFDAITPEWWPF